MTKRKKVIIILISCIMLLTVFWRIYYNPKQIFKRKFGFDLPQSARIEQYEYAYFGENTLAAKITFGPEDYEYMEKKLLPQGWTIHNEVINIDNTILQFQNQYSWWDLKPENTVAAYYGERAGRFAKTTIAFVFFGINEEGQYAVYLQR